MGNHAAIHEVNDAIRHKRLVTIETSTNQHSLPDSDTPRGTPASGIVGGEDLEQAREILRGEPLFQCLAGRSTRWLYYKIRDSIISAEGTRHRGRRRGRIRCLCSAWQRQRLSSQKTVQRLVLARCILAIASVKCRFWTGERRTATVRAAARTATFSKSANP